MYRRKYEFFLYLFLRVLLPEVGHPQVTVMIELTFMSYVCHYGLAFPLGEPGHTRLYVGLPCAWGSVDGDLMFFPICMLKGSFLGTPADIHE